MPPLTPRPTQFLKFVFAAGLSVPVNLGSRIALSLVTSYEVAIIISHVLGMATAYLLTKLFVFETSGRAAHSELGRFALVNLLSVTQTWIVSVGLLRVVFPTIGFDVHPELVAHAIGLASASVTSFWGHKHFSFGKKYGDRPTAPHELTGDARPARGQPAAAQVGGIWVGRIERRAGVLLFLALLVLSTRRLLGSWRGGVLLTGDSPLLYNAATLGFSYFEFGAVRRGLGGSIVYLFDKVTGSTLLAAVLFHLLSAAAVAAAAAWMWGHLHRSRNEKLLLAVLMIAIMMCWAEDPGRTDMLVAAFLGLAAACLLRRSLVLACATLSVGLAVHETSFIYGVPLLAGLLLDRGRWRELRRPDVLGAIAVLSLVLGLYAAIDWLPHATTQTMVASVRSRFPQQGMADWSVSMIDWALYFALAGVRGVNTAICQNVRDPTYPLHVASGLLVIAWFMVLLRRRRPSFTWAALVVAVLPYVFLSAIGNDISRWTLFAAFNLWLLSAATTEPPAPARAGWRWQPVALALLLIPLIHPRLWKITFPIFAPIPAVDRLWFGMAKTRPLDIAEECDPNWRSTFEPVGVPVAPAGLR